MTIEETLKDCELIYHVSAMSEEIQLKKWLEVTIPRKNPLLGTYLHNLNIITPKRLALARC